jgi:hypothetical protein
MEEVMHTLELTDSELRVLAETAKARAREMEAELVHTDDRAFRASLRRDLECLEALQQKLVAEEGAEPRVRG